MHDLASLTRTSALTWLATSTFAHALAEESDEASVEPADEEIEEVVVTGPRFLLDETAPVTVLTRHDIERGGATSIGDVLQKLPMNVNSPLAPQSVYGTNGAVRVALRGHATLVLLNGRRFPNGGAGADTSVDLNTLPISFVERVEVLPSGAGAGYGSDAVGGVINIVTRGDMVGLTVAGSQALTGHGDGGVTMGQVAAGLELFGGIWFVGVERVKQDSVTADRRDYSTVERVIIDADGTRVPFGSTITGAGYFTIPASNVLGLPRGIYTRVEGATGQTAADYRPIDPVVDYFNGAQFFYLQAPTERGALWLIGSLPLNERVAFFVEGLVEHQQTVQETEPAQYAGWHVPTLADETLGIPAASYYNPFGVDLVLPDSFVTRRMVELGTRTFSEEADLWRMLAGLEGMVAGWEWNLSAGIAESGSTSVDNGVFLRARLVPSLGPSGPDGTGRIVCGTPDPATGIVSAPDIVPDCVPVNLFGGPGSITREQLDYISAGVVPHAGTNEQQTAELVFTGPWGKLSGRKFEWVLGAELRLETGSFELDPRLVAETGMTILSTAEDYVTRDLFAEVRFPLLRDRRWTRELDLNLGLRLSNSSAFDYHLSGQAGLRWQPFDEWTFRTNYADVYNEPGLWALYDPPKLDLSFERDPCGNNPAPEQQLICAANGVPGGTYTQTARPFEVVFGGNPELQPETGYSMGAGLKYVPRWAPGLSVSADYYYLEISNLIRSLSVETVLGECAALGLPEICDDIERFPDGSVRRLSTVNENFGGRFETSGVDVVLAWEGTMGPGNVTARLRGSYLDRWKEQPFLDGTLYDYAGRIEGGAMPRWRGMGTVDWTSGRWVLGYSAEYIGSYSQPVEPLLLQYAIKQWGSPFESYRRRIEPMLYHDLEGRYEFDNGMTVRAAITNLTDEDPPFVNMAGQANTDAGTYRLLGRTFFLELRYDFAGRRG
jgi:outer membrane receptor protein involved in Fe transport